MPPKRKAEDDAMTRRVKVGEYHKNDGDRFRFQAYMKAIKAIRDYPAPITSGKEALKLNGVGKKIAEKIDEILSTGRLKKLDKIHEDPKAMAVNLLSRVHGIGPSTAKKLVDDGITTLEQLSALPDLTTNQRLGIKYFSEFEEKIPREEVTRLWNIAQDIIRKTTDGQVTATLCGSYRRGKAFSGDLDVLITHPQFRSDNTNSQHHKRIKAHLLRSIVENMMKLGYVTDVLSEGEVKFMGVCILPGGEQQDDDDAVAKGVNKRRRLDIRLIPADQYHCGVLYFTGSRDFNVHMRQMALNKGLTLNEYYIRPIDDTGEVGKPLEVHCERDVFDILNMKYLPPEDRDW